MVERSLSDTCLRSAQPVPGRISTTQDVATLPCPTSFVTGSLPPCVHTVRLPHHKSKPRPSNRRRFTVFKQKDTCPGYSKTARDTNYPRPKETTEELKCTSLVSGPKQTSAFNSLKFPDPASSGAPSGLTKRPLYASKTPSHKRSPQRLALFAQNDTLERRHAPLYDADERIQSEDYLWRFLRAWSSSFPSKVAS
jgi:hypothetical protein